MNQGRSIGLVGRLLAIALCVGCSGDGTGPDLDAVASVAVSPPQVSLGVGGTTKLTATVRNGREEVVSAPVSWQSLTPSVASVDGEGVVRGLSEGAAEIRASAEGEFGTATITIAGDVELTVEVSAPAAVVLEGGSLQLAATVSGTGTDDRGLVWSIDGRGGGNATVGTVSSTGVYVAPARVTRALVITIRATSSGDPTASGAIALRLGTAGEDWPQYRRDLAKSGQSAEVGLSSANVDELQEVWRFPTGSRVSVSPAVATVAGVRSVYVGTWAGTFFAIDAVTGAERWRYDIDLVEEDCGLNYPQRIASSPAVDGGIVYFGSGNGYLYALSAATGQLIWKKLLGDPCEGYEIWSSPTVYDGVVYIGVASRDGVPCVVGRVDALEAATGTTVWSFDTIDQTTSPDGDAVGAGVWSSAAIDADAGLLYVGTGNNARGCSPPRKNALLYPDGILAMDLSGGQPVSFYQTFPDDLNDEGDVGATPVLHRTRVFNECTGAEQVSDWLTVPTKDGKVFTGRRGPGGLIGDPEGIDLASGAALASPALEPFTSSSPCGSGSKQLVVEGNDLYVPTFAGRLFDLRQEADGSIETRWALQASPCAGCPLISAPALINDLLFFGGGEGNFYAATTEGERVFTFGTGGLVSSGPAISHGTVYFGSYDGNVYALGTGAGPAALRED